MSAAKIIHGDCLTELTALADNSIDFICTDPPYGYSFMGKDWDKAVPSVEIWQECLRVLKPGAFMCVMSAPRSDVLSRMIINIENAGFRVDFTPIYWTYASGFPKAGNIRKLVDKRLGAEREVIGTGQYNSRRPRATKETNTPGAEFGFNAGDTITAPSSPQAKALDGSYAGFQPKPAVEVIIVAMKPLSEKTYVDQALANGKGITWLDDGRIPTDGNIQKGGTVSGGYHGDIQPGVPHSSSRFPANLLCSDDVLNDGVERKSGKMKAGQARNSKPLFGSTNDYICETIGDSGSYSRYFDLDKWAETLPFLAVPKASKSEKNKGLEHLEPKLTIRYQPKGQGPLPQQTPSVPRPEHNHHPTVKPLKLMSYLITLFSRPGDVVLDPFVGSGTTCLAAQNLGRRSIGIERDAEYVAIAEARLEVRQPQLELEAA